MTSGAISLTTQGQGGPSAPARAPTTALEFVASLPRNPHMRVEVINSRVIVSHWGNPRHSRIISLLVTLLGPVADARGWRVWPSLDVRTAHTCEPLIPDLAIGPKGAPRWGEDEILSNGLVLVAEVVSRSSVREDREDKPVIYAKGGVPFMLVVDPIAEPPTVTLWSDPGDDGYRTVTKVKMGEELPIPHPVDCALDTSAFIRADRSRPLGPPSTAPDPTAPAPTGPPT
ncbi:Uma2 family endonuclease [Spongiactinospora sp. 9N601]|uniref:Uma2 family endonuclease n=1 Tax=Spongiactinospora sp. 9N601 TaxID=3375149 RepID=UPI0037B71614